MNSERHARPRLVDAALNGTRRDYESGGTHLIGVLPGEGIGPEIVTASLGLLDVLTRAGLGRFEIRTGGAIGKDAEHESGQSLTPAVESFCEEVFADGGAVFCGPGGGRFVYDLRRRFDLFFKLVPLMPRRAVCDVGPLRPSAVAGVDVLVVRENVGGLYQGSFGARELPGGDTEAYHHFGYRASDIERLLRVAARLAAARRGLLSVVGKPGGAPSITSLWAEQAERLGAEYGVRVEMVDVDNACYQLVARAHDFDVVAAPNMFGDVVADGATVLLGSRGMSYSANYGIDGRAVYQTGHGAAYDLQGKDVANPLGQIESLAFMLRESFGLTRAAAALDAAVESVLAAGIRTADVLGGGHRLVGTRAMAHEVEEALVGELASSTPRP